MIQDDKLKRIKQELHNAGATRYGSLKSEADRLPSIIRDDEHILGVVYGSIDDSSAMLVATTMRLIFIDVKPIHVVTDEISYANVSDIRVDFGLVYAKVTLMTRARTFNFRYVNQTCARIFLNAIEKMTLTKGRQKMNAIISQQTPSQEVGLVLVDTEDPYEWASDEIAYVKNHHIAVISSFGEDSYPYGATVFYFIDTSDPNVLHVITRDVTPTARNTRRKPKVGLTITDETDFCTMHIKGVASREPDTQKAHQLLIDFMNSDAYVPTDMLPPVNQLKKGSFVILKITIHTVYMHKYHIPGEAFLNN